MLLTLLDCSLRNNTLSGIGQTNDLQLIIYPEACDELDKLNVAISLQLGPSTTLAPQDVVFHKDELVFTKRVDPAIFATALSQTMGQFSVTMQSGEVLQSSFTKIQFTNQNLTNCWESVSLGYSADLGNIGFAIIVVPATCQFAKQVQATLMYQNISGVWNSITIKSGGNYDSEDYNHLATTQFERPCVGVFTEEEVQACNKFIEDFREFRTMPMKLVINYVVSDIQVSVQGGVQNYYTPRYQSCMEKLGITVFVTQQAAITSFLADEFKLCGFGLDDVILTMEINLVSGNFSYGQKKNFTVAETLYFPQASFYFDQDILEEMFAAKDPFIAHYFLSLFDHSSQLQQEASFSLNSTVSCFNYINFTVSSKQVCAKVKFNFLMTSCTFSATVPVEFKGMWVQEKVQPFLGTLLPVFTMRKNLEINYSLVQQDLCMSCGDAFSGGDCSAVLSKYAKFYVSNPDYVLIGMESLQGQRTDFKQFAVSFSTDIYLVVIVSLQVVIAVVFFISFGGLMVYIKIQENKRML
ncbi:hypothetical protein SS50377_25016 [Spironucleus salmonicida]|uniref:Transmembrane protein n=1 Tax=Spironucleus salmonicida TaxID=348837 RepID=V6LFJ8_9EUKA|nr:hypothetical protein SS50377_25008 [Spironucleus salmonicida]KAH0572901.1 hypothetical protein SS50377_25016 [Spironucleus salmonicida]|eukprot:EST43068.1 Hypothetical protein SS50377_17225 [Spironucleus salmonicida]